MSIKQITTFLIRFFAVWFVDSLAIIGTYWILPGFLLTGSEDAPVLAAASAAAFILGLVNFLIRPIILLMAVPLGMIFVFLFGLLVNSVALLITASLLPALQINSWGSAFLGSIIFSAINIILTNLITLTDENSFYQGLVERLAKRRMYPLQEPLERGLVMLEIDGLSFRHIKKAVAEGWMPNINRMIKTTHALSHVDCGLPSQTSACQSGIMFGDNYDIPAFRWLDKDKNKLMVSSGDASEINARYANGTGLMRSGSSINNMMNGDAQNSILTLADLRRGTAEEKKQRANDLYLLFLNPYFLIRTLILFLWDVGLELFQAFRQRVRNEHPRLNRLHKGYPFLRAATTVIMRDVAANLARLEIIRGSPSIYLTYPGYDEVAHHSGPSSRDAYGTLRQFDNVIGNIWETIQQKSPRHYDLMILSDHGQSFGATFLQRYGYNLKEFIEKQLPENLQAVQVSGGDDGTPSMGAMAAEIENIWLQGVGGTISQSVAREAADLLNRGANIRDAETNAAAPANVTVCGSGNLAQVYFDLFPRKITLEELESAYPGMVDAIVNHDGVGFIVGYDNDNTPLLLGKRGKRNLHTGEVQGEDPLIGFGDENFRAGQVRRIADFPHSGDLIVNSTLYPDGTVAAMEELIGNHGGLGGEQTDAFLLHPADMQVPQTSNSADIFTILNNRRQISGEIPEPTQPAEEQIHVWRPGFLIDGIARVKSWLSLFMGAILLQRTAYREIARNEIMTGPAILLGIIGTIVYTETRSGGVTFGTIIIQIATWFFSVVIINQAGKLLKGVGAYRSTLRVLGFAQGAYLLDLLSFFPALTSVVRMLVSMLSFIALWVGASTAHELKGWRTLLLPVVNVLVIIIGIVLFSSVIGGFALSIQSLAVDFGIIPAR